MKQIINCENGEIIERELTEEELAQEIQDEARSAKLKEEAQVRLEARALLLKRLGITEEEAKLLLG